MLKIDLKSNPQFALLIIGITINFLLVSVDKLQGLKGSYLKSNNATDASDGG
jgi:hypothetical protein